MSRSLLTQGSRHLPPWLILDVRRKNIVLDTVPVHVHDTVHMTTIHKGSCLCGRVRYEIHGAISQVLNCHCSDCRKSHGAAFRTRGRVRVQDFVWLSGRELVTKYHSTPNEYRTFCSVCGANIVTEFIDNPGEFGFALGTLDTDPGVKPQCHIFVSDKAPWYDITDELPQYAVFPPKHETA